MWNLGNRDIIVLVSVISGCTILFNVWGPYVALTITFVLVVCAWLTYVVADDDTPFTPHARLVIYYLEAACRESDEFIALSYERMREYANRTVEASWDICRVHVVGRMAQRRRSTYQLSSDGGYASSKNSSRFNLVDGLSPIVRGTYRPDAHSSNLENSYADANSIIANHAGSLGKVTSTPLVPWQKEVSKNGDVHRLDDRSIDKGPWTKSASVSQNHTLSRGEDTTYSPEGSPWGTSISPKMRARAGGVKTVQTVAGPLLASTRYNIDPKVYSDVTSPGLTTRLTKYATEANNKLTHQSQYATGQFPRVNLNSSPTPLINMKSGKMRMPVTVRVAPPENTRYSPPERQKILSNICHAESKASPSVVQVLRDISLKRHASREDVTFELAKKQRTEGVFSAGLENLEEMTQKRGRDDSSRSEEDISPQNKSLRPAKRSKMPSCYDIISSLSSSISVSSGVKRKAIDISRSGTPDLGKHFKSLDSCHGDGTATNAVTRTISEPIKSNKRTLNELDVSRNSDVHSPRKKSLESNSNRVYSQKGITVLKSPPIVAKAADDNAIEKSRAIDKRETRIVAECAPIEQRVSVKLTDKLFMKAEPQNIDKLKTLIEEHGSIKPRFTTHDTDEIKKSDIVNMRQTSMKTRLKSMFDAISGKVPSKINPEVVIQAEEVKASTSSSITASLNSSTSTTNVNTSPIATSAIVPIIGKTKANDTPAKHVTFQLKSTETSVKANVADTAKVLTTSDAPELKETKRVESPSAVEKPAAATNSLFQTRSSPSTTTSVAAFSFGSSSLSTSPSSTANASATLAPKTTSFASLPSTAHAAVTTSSSQFNSTPIFAASTTSASLFANATPSIAKSVAATPSTFDASIQPVEKNTQATAGGFSLAKQTTSGPAGSLNAYDGFKLSSDPIKASQGPAVSTRTEGAVQSTNIFGTGNAIVAAPTAFGNPSSSSFANTEKSATASMFSFGGNAASQTPDKKGFAFGATTSNSPQITSTVDSVVASPSVVTAISAAPAATPGGFGFSSSNAAPTKSTSLFGTVTTASSTTSSAFPTAASTTAAFTFGSNSTAASKPFSFGANANAPVATAASTGSTLSFGTTSNGAAPLFGAPSTTSSATTTAALSSIFGTPITTVAAAATTAGNQTSLFGAPATSAVATTAPTFGAASNQPSFAATPNAFGTQKTMETPAFGASMGPPPAFAATSTASGLFGGVNSNPTVAPTTAAPAFGTSSFGQTKPPPAFGANVTSTFASNSGGTSLFGSQTVTSTVAFGTATPVASVSTSMFGTPSTPAQNFGTPTTAPPPFGTTNTSTTSFGAAATTIPSFGTINTSTPTFGAQSSAVGSGANQNFSTPSPGFGAVTTAAPPAFGTAITSPAAFGASTTSGFGNPTNPSLTFSTGTGIFAGFGAGTGTNVPSPFGSQPTSATPSFGTSSSATPAFGGGNNSTSSFTFGGSQPAAQPVQQQQQQSAVFSFGGSGPAPSGNASSGSAPFQFGSTAPQAGGFNFTGAASTPALNFSKDATAASGGAFAAPTMGANSFNAPTTGGMFSIGSGSTGPRSRPSRRRQR